MYRLLELRKKKASDYGASTDEYSRSGSDTGKTSKDSVAVDSTKRNKKKTTKKKNYPVQKNRPDDGNGSLAEGKGNQSVLDQHGKIFSNAGGEQVVNSSPSAAVVPNSLPSEPPKNVELVSKAIPQFKGKSGKAAQNVMSRKKKISAPPSNGVRCTVCNEQFQWQRDLDAHLELHGIGYECAVCKVILPTATEYAHHRISTHYVCNIGECDYFFGYPNGLTFHIQRKHGQEPQFPCPVCGVTYRSSLGLYRHQLKCKPEQIITLYKCEFCGTMVSQSSRSEHETSCKAKYQSQSSQPTTQDDNAVLLNCQFCNAIVQNAEDKIDHEQNCYSNPSKKMQCKLCKKIFTGAMQLGKHLMGVHKQQATLCIYCHHGFSDKEAREEHYATCPGKNPRSSEAKGMTLRTKKQLQSRELSSS